MSDYLVTGGAGFIGAAVVRSLLNEGHNVITIDNLSTGKLSNVPIDCAFIEGNTYEISTISKLNEKYFDAIIHIAGQSSGEISFENPIYDLQTNTQSSLLLLDYAKKTGCKNFIYASTMSVYGDQENTYVDESFQVNPKSFYAIGKIASEEYMKIYSKYGIRCTALRLFNVYGVGQNMDNLKQGMFSIFLSMAIEKRHIMVKGSKNRFRDFIYIDDVVDAFNKSITRNKGEDFEIYNISSGNKYTVELLINRIKEVTPETIIVEYAEGTPGDQYGIVGNSEKALADLNWRAKMPFEKGTLTMIQWARRVK